MNALLISGLTATLLIILMSGYPVAIVLGASALGYISIVSLFSGTDLHLLSLIPNRLFGILTNQTLLAVPFFVLMGVFMERAKIAENLLGSLAQVLRALPGSLGLSVVIVGALMAASTGIVGATVVTLGLLALRPMLEAGYSQSESSGILCATGTLGQIIPPSIALVLLGDVMSAAYQESQLSQGSFSPKPVSVGDLFAGALIPGFVLVVMYATYVMIRAGISGKKMSKFGNEPLTLSRFIYALVLPLSLVVLVLGSILFGFATPTEAASVGAMGALYLAFHQRALSKIEFMNALESALKTTAMIFFILIGASIFSLVFRALEGDAFIKSIFTALPGEKLGALIVTMVVMFLLGFILDFIEITLVFIPLVAPVLLGMGFHPIWLAIMMAINLQTSFLTPPFGFSLFYLQGVAPKTFPLVETYRGVMPFIVMQIVLLVMLYFFPDLVMIIPNYLSNA